MEEMIRTCHGLLRQKFFLQAIIILMIQPITENGNKSMGIYQMPTINQESLSI